MFPVLYEIVLGPVGGTVALYIIAVVLPVLLAWRAWKDAQEGLVEKNRWIKVLGISLAVCIASVSFFIRPWLWEEPLEIPLHTYGFMIAIGFISGIVVVMRAAKSENLDQAHILDMAFWALLFGLVGSRVLFIIVNTDQYFGEAFMSTIEMGGHSVPVPTILVFWRGGLVFFGGFIGAALALVIYMRKFELPAWQYADVAVLAVPLGHFFGRVGCFAAGCCYGKPCVDGGSLCAHFPAGSLAFNSTRASGQVEIAGEMFSRGLYPTQLFEAGAVLLIFIILILIRRYKRFDGQLIITYLILYPLVRTVIEFFRGDFSRGMLFRFPTENPVMLSTSQFISILVALTGFVLILYRIRKAGSKTNPVMAGSKGG